MKNMAPLWALLGSGTVFYKDGAPDEACCNRANASLVRGVIFPLSKTSRFFSNAFNAISRPRCPARKMWEGIIPAVSTRKNVGHVQLRSGKRVKTVRRSRVGHSVGYPTHSIAREGGLIG